MATLNSVQCLFHAKMGTTTISEANSNLNGSGPLGTIITGGANGTYVKTLIIKAQTDTDEGMVRVFAKKTGGAVLLTEFYIPPIIKSGRDLSFYDIISLDYFLASDEQLCVSTQNENTFNLIAEAFDLSYASTTTFIGSSIEYTANSGIAIIDEANPNLDGTGAMSQIFTSGSSTSGFRGCAITMLSIKAQQTTSPGMIRLFIQDNLGSALVLFCEVMVPSVVQGATTQAFEWQVIEEGSLCLPPDYSIYASTENSNIFGITVEAGDWKYI